MSPRRKGKYKQTRSTVVTVVHCTVVQWNSGEQYTVLAFVYTCLYLPFLRSDVFFMHHSFCSCCCSLFDRSLHFLIFAFFRYWWWSFETEIDFSILVFNILNLNELTDFVLVQIVSTVYEIYAQNRYLVLFWSRFDSQCPLIDDHDTHEWIYFRTHLMMFSSRPFLLINYFNSGQSLV